jgi:hypothetical protein
MSKIGQLLLCTNTQPLQYNDVAPPLTEGEKYIIKNVVQDRKGYLHYDVGLPSRYNFIRSQESGEYLPKGDQIHWCHPSRFVEITESVG